MINTRKMNSLLDFLGGIAMITKKETKKVKNEVLRKIIDEVLEEKKKRCSFPYWPNWRDWGNWWNGRY